MKIHLDPLLVVLHTDHLHLRVCEGECCDALVGDGI